MVIFEQSFIALIPCCSALGQSSTSGAAHTCFGCTATRGFTMTLAGIKYKSETLFKHESLERPWPQIPGLV